MRENTYYSLESLDIRVVDYPVLLLGHSQLSVKLKKKFSASLLFIKNTKDNFLIYSSLLINYNAYIAKKPEWIRTWPTYKNTYYKKVKYTAGLETICCEIIQFE